VLLAADQSKFGRSAMVQLGNISQADHFFTDAPPPEAMQEHMVSHDVTLHVV